MRLATAQFVLGLPMGCLAMDDLPALMFHDRLVPVLVRCGGCRFTCAAQDVERLVLLVEMGGEYVRDVSVPVAVLVEARAVVAAHDLEFAQQWAALRGRQEVVL